MNLLALPLWRQAFRGLGAVLCNVIYSLISWIYQLFMVVSRLNILSEDGIAPIYQRVTMILTIVMTFYITFEAIKYIIQPDTLTDKEKGVGNILQRMVIVIVLIAFVPQIFSLAYKAQNAVIKNQVLSKVILGQKDTDAEKFGSEFSANILSLFYSIDKERCTPVTGKCSEASEIVQKSLEDLRENGTANILDGINTPVEAVSVLDGTPAINFNGVLAVLVGGLIVYILALYSVDVGTRYVQLLFLQIIAPIAIMGYILPKKDGIFQKWTKQCITTYIDLFIRIAIIYFVILIIRVLGNAMDANDLFNGIEGVTDTIKAFAYIVLVMGLLAFAQRAPKLLGDLLPSNGSASIGFGLKAAERVAPGAARVIAAGIGGVNGLARKGIASGVNRYKRNRENEDERSTGQERRNHRNDLREKNIALRKARENLRNMRRSGTQEEVEKAREEYRQAQNEQIDAQSQVAKDKNKQYRSVTGAAVGGMITGAMTGLTTGAQATKLQDINKKVQEGTKKINESVSSVESYYDAGGTSTIDRTITRVEQSIGIQTPSQRTAEEIKRLDAQIKGADAVISLQRAPKQSVDSAEERGQSKAKTGELKISAEGITIKTGLKDRTTGKDITITGQAGQKLSDIYLDVQKDAEIKKSALDEAIRSGASQAEIDRLKIESSNADTKAAIVLKNVSRAAFTKYLQGKVSENEKDAVMENHVANAVNNLNRTLDNRNTRDQLIKEIENRVKEGKLRQEVLDAVETRDYHKLTFDEFDEVKNILINISNNNERELSLIKDTKARIETSSMYDAQKANASGGGKK